MNVKVCGIGMKRTGLPQRNGEKEIKNEGKGV